MVSLPSHQPMNVTVKHRVKSLASTNPKQQILGNWPVEQQLVTVGF